MPSRLIPKFIDPYGPIHDSFSVYVSIIERGEKEPGLQFRLTLNYILIRTRNGIDPRAR
jgi:hypothetical protein